METADKLQASLHRALTELDRVSTYDGEVVGLYYGLGSDRRANLIAEADFWMRAVQYNEAWEQLERPSV